MVQNILRSVPKTCGINSGNYKFLGETDFIHAKKNLPGRNALLAGYGKASTFLRCQSKTLSADIYFMFKL